jgi:hypothetical protein
VFLSKIWFFLVAIAAAAALTVALVMPRPAQRQIDGEEKNRLGIACSVIDIVLADNARTRVELAGSFARAPTIVTALEAASGAATLDEARMKQVRDVAGDVMKGVSGHGPDFAMLIDNKGRVVARVTLDEGDFGDVVAGRPLVDDALAGYLRDDIWAQNGTMYLVSAAPVIRRDPPVTYVGAIVLGNKITNDLAKTVVGKIDVDVGFYLGNDDVAGSRTIALDHAPMLSALGKLSGTDLAQDCRSDNQFAMHAGNEDFVGVVGRLPGEAQAHQAFFTVFMQKRAERGFMGTLKAVQKSDVTFGKFPWILVVGAFVVALALGIAFMWMESDRPLRRLADDAVKLAKNERERLAEDTHGGKYGSIARSVNIHIDKLGRDAKSARTNLDQLLGPAPEGSLGTIDLLAGALPTTRPGGAAPVGASPPSDFKFHDPAPPAPAPVVRAAPTPAPMSAMAAPPRSSAPPMRAHATPPRGSQTPPPRPPTPAPVPAAQQTQPLHLDDDILAPAEPSIDPYFKQVYDQFLAVKKSCGEATAGLTYGKFSEKLVKNRDDLMAKTGCREVRFTVYVKDGKAALKATPVKDEA